MPRCSKCKGTGQIRTTRKTWIWRAKDLGVASDEEIAERVGREVSTVRRARILLGIPSPASRTRLLDECVLNAIDPYSVTTFRDLMYTLENDYGSANYRTVYRSLKRHIQSGVIERVTPENKMEWGYRKVGKIRNAANG